MLSKYNTLILEMSIFPYIYIYIFHHLKLEIALTIPASNEEKIKANNSITPVASGHGCHGKNPT